MTVKVECVGKVTIAGVEIIVKSNTEQVEKIGRIAQTLSLESATLD